jgi:hypothetical protein
VGVTDVGLVEAADKKLKGAAVHEGLSEISSEIRRESDIQQGKIRKNTLALLEIAPEELLKAENTLREAVFVAGEGKKREALHHNIA